jgi:hypothetical protein
MDLNRTDAECLLTLPDGTEVRIPLSSRAPLIAHFERQRLLADPSAWWGELAATKVPPTGRRGHPWSRGALIQGKLETVMAFGDEGQVAALLGLAPAKPRPGDKPIKRDQVVAAALAKLGEAVAPVTIRSNRSRNVMGRYLATGRSWESADGKKLSLAPDELVDTKKKRHRNR